MYNHNQAQQSKNRVHISWDILYLHGISPGELLITLVELPVILYSMTLMWRHFSVRSSNFF